MKPLGPAGKRAGNRPRDAELDELLAPLRDGPIALSGVSDAHSRRERLLPFVRDQVQRAPERRRKAIAQQRLRWFATASVGLSMAAGVLLAMTSGLLPLGQSDVKTPLASTSMQFEPLTHDPNAASWIDAHGERRALDDAALLDGPGELVAADSSWARLSTSQGVHIELAPRSHLRVKPQLNKQDAALRLERGEVHCQVPKLGKRNQFAIATPDALVIVHGTRFKVRVGEPGEGTCVAVTEGLVEVRSGGKRVMLPPGTQYGCEPEIARAEDAALRAEAASAGQNQQANALPQPAAIARTETVRNVRQRPSKAALRNARRRAAIAAAAANRDTARGDSHESAVASTKPAADARLTPEELGTLADENRLLSAALNAERSGDLPRAQRLFSDLLARNPSSPLAPEARSGLSRTR